MITGWPAYTFFGPLSILDTFILFPYIFQQGKDAILDALASLCSCCHAGIIAEDSSLPSGILDAVCAACNKKTKLYREAAFLCLQKVFFFIPHLIIGPLLFVDLPFLVLADIIFFNRMSFDYLMVIIELRFFLKVVT